MQTLPQAQVLRLQQQQRCWRWGLGRLGSLSAFAYCHRCTPPMSRQAWQAFQHVEPALMLRAAGGRCDAAAESSMRAGTVTRAALEAACGQAARCLKAYQVAGINYLMLLNTAVMPGCILADEMGLGKTCQLICYLGTLRRSSRPGSQQHVRAPCDRQSGIMHPSMRYCRSQPCPEQLEEEARPSRVAWHAHGSHQHARLAMTLA